jgi:hypothetical protein
MEHTLITFTPITLSYSSSSIPFLFPNSLPSTFMLSFFFSSRFYILRENKQYLSPFWRWLNFLNMTSTSIHFFANDIISFFLWLSNTQWCTQTTFSLFTSCWASTRFSNLAIVNNALINTGVQLPLWYADWLLGQEFCDTNRKLSRETLIHI